MIAERTHLPQRVQHCRRCCRAVELHRQPTQVCEVSAVLDTRLAVLHLPLHACTVRQQRPYHARRIGSGKDGSVGGYSSRVDGGLCAEHAESAVADTSAEGRTDSGARSECSYAACIRQQHVGRCERAEIVLLPRAAHHRHESRADEIGVHDGSHLNSSVISSRTSECRSRRSAVTQHQCDHCGGNAGRPHHLHSAANGCEGGLVDCGYQGEFTLLVSIVHTVNN